MQTLQIRIFRQLYFGDFTRFAQIPNNGFSVASHERQVGASYNTSVGAGSVNRFVIGGSGLILKEDY